MSEMDARMKIDRLLREAGWAIEDKTQISTEAQANGRADYLLRDRTGKPLAVVEAKAGDIDPYTAKNQAARYAKDAEVRFAFLSNGDKTYFWDLKEGDARVVEGFYSRNDLERLANRDIFLKPLSDIPVDSLIVERPYQVEACRAIDAAVLARKRKILVEMATGTGKTRTIAAEIKRLVQSGLVGKVLFLVDREELANQAVETFKDHIKEYRSYIYRWASPREGNTITVATLQTIQNHFRSFSVGYFDLVVIDECHRSIYGEWRKILDYFDAIKIGLTATPAELSDRNTFQFFETKAPHFVYGMRQAIDDHFLADYTVYVGRTDISLNGVVDTETGETYLPADLERKITVPERNLEIVRDYKAVAKPNSKSIWFCVNQRHAAEITRMLNEEHPEYGGKFADLVDYTVEDKDLVIKRFKTETLPLALVSVDMLTTGFDAPQVESLVVIRPTKSPILYQQIRGRGTRLFIKDGEVVKDKFVFYDYVGVYEYFKSLGFEDKGEKAGKGTRPAYSPGAVVGTDGEDGGRREELKVIHAEDRMVQKGFIDIGAGERIDIRSYQETFEKAVLSKAEELEVLKKIRSEKYGDITEEEVAAAGEAIEGGKSRGYYGLSHLRKAYAQPKADWLDFLKVALGKARFPTHEEEVDRVFADWAAGRKLTQEQEMFLSALKNQILANHRKVAIEDLQNPPYTQFGGFGKAVQLFGEAVGDTVEELNTVCFINAE